MHLARALQERVNETACTANPHGCHNVHMSTRTWDFFVFGTCTTSAPMLRFGLLVGVLLRARFLRLPKVGTKHDKQQGFYPNKPRPTLTKLHPSRNER